MPADKPKSAAKADPVAGERIAKVLSRAGIASRREAERMIETGQIAINGRVIDSPALNVTATDRITVNGQPLAPPEPPRLWLYYKPEGLVTSAADEKGRDTVFDHLPEDMPRVMSVGRLDLNSEGLLLLTNDGELKRRLELPSTGWLRKYRVRINGNPVDPDLEPLRRGIVVDGERFQPMEVKLDRVQGANAWLTVGLREGRNREIRRAMNAIGLYVNRLIRVSYGPFRLGELEPGDVEEVRPSVLRDQLGLATAGTAQKAGRRPPESQGSAKPRTEDRAARAPQGRSDVAAAKSQPKPRGPAKPAAAQDGKPRTAGSRSAAGAAFTTRTRSAAEDEDGRPPQGKRFASAVTSSSGRPRSKGAEGRDAEGRAAASAPAKGKTFAARGPGKPATGGSRPARGGGPPSPSGPGPRRPRG